MIYKREQADLSLIDLEVVAIDITSTEPEICVIKPILAEPW